MKFQQTAVLLGVVGKKGTGQLDGGGTWTTDRVELHVITPFSDGDQMAHGKTVTCYQVQDYLKHYEHAKSLIDQEVVLHMEMEPSKKLGMPGKMICTGFQPLRVAKVG